MKSVEPFCGFVFGDGETHDINFFNDNNTPPLVAVDHRPAAERPLTSSPFATTIALPFCLYFLKSSSILVNNDLKV